MITITEKETLENKIDALAKCIDNLTELYEMHSDKIKFLMKRIGEVED